jgi:hypothetical protein
MAMDERKLQRELEQLKVETSTPEIPIGSVWDGRIRDDQEACLTDYYALTGELPTPAEIKPRRGSLAEAVAVHQARLIDQQIKRAEQNRQYRERHREKLQAYNTNYKRKMRENA